MFPSSQELEFYKKAITIGDESFQLFIKSLLELMKAYRDNRELCFTNTIKDLKDIIDTYWVESSMVGAVNKVVGDFGTRMQEMDSRYTTEVQNIYKNQLEMLVTMKGIPNIFEVVMHEVFRSISSNCDLANQRTLEKTSRALEAMSATLTTAGLTVAGVYIGSLAFNVAATAGNAGVGVTTVLQGFTTGAFTMSARATTFLIGGTVGVVLSIAGTCYLVYQLKEGQKKVKMVRDDMVVRQDNVKEEAKKDVIRLKQKLEVDLEEYRSRTAAMLSSMETQRDIDTHTLMEQVKEVKDLIQKLPQIELQGINGFLLSDK
jgi:hypothetical protein